MPQEFKTQGEPLEKDVKTKVTYHGDDNAPEFDVIYGVPMKKGQSVDLKEHMDPERAARFAEKLKSNPQFEVEGTPRAKTPEQQQRLDPESVRLAGRQVGEARAAAQMKGQEPPEGYDAPLQAMLESQKPQGRQQQEPEPPPQRSSPPRGRG